jgi:hypothetical protein
MTLSNRQQHQLHRIEDDLHQSAPMLAATLSAFGALSATEAMPAWEQVPTRQERTMQAAALTARALTVLAAAIGFLLNAILALLIAIVQGRPARPTARRHDQARSGRWPDPADGS